MGSGTDLPWGSQKTQLNVFRKSGHQAHQAFGSPVNVVANVATAQMGVTASNTPKSTHVKKANARRFFICLCDTFTSNRSCYGAAFWLP